jgi:hypothetical protein
MLVGTGFKTRLVRVCGFGRISGTGRRCCGGGFETSLGCVERGEAGVEGGGEETGDWEWEVADDTAGEERESESEDGEEDGEGGPSGRATGGGGGAAE